jgi:hypothetical protein
VIDFWGHYLLSCFYLRQCFGVWILSPSSGKNLTRAQSMDGARPYLLTPEPSQGRSRVGRLRVVSGYLEGSVYEFGIHTRNINSTHLVTLFRKAITITLKRLLHHTESFRHFSSFPLLLSSTPNFIIHISLLSLLVLRIIVFDRAVLRIGGSLVLSDFER